MTHTKTTHPFTNPQLSYDVAPNIQPCIKMSFFFNKLPQVSDEHFHRHWETVHADLTIAAQKFKVCKLERYVQVHQTSEMKEKAKSLGLTHLDFDGCSEIWNSHSVRARNWDDWMEFYNSKEYAEAMQPDCKLFMAMPIHVMIGYENLIFGPAIPGEGNTDGVTAENLRTR